MADVQEFVPQGFEHVVSWKSNLQSFLPPLSFLFGKGDLLLFSSRSRSPCRQQYRLPFELFRITPSRWMEAFPICLRAA